MLGVVMLKTLMKGFFAVKALPIFEEAAKL